MKHPRPGHPVREPRSKRRGERGATVIELALLMPVILAVSLLVVQVALWFHGRQVAEAAAREGARVARSAPYDSGSWAADAESKAEEIARAVGPKLLSDLQVEATTRGEDERWVAVTASAVQVIPLLPELAFTITARSGGPVECFRPDDGTGRCG
ncbi:TadE/TadG family type IV pilus assembly protein [Nonomuraea sp. NPDC050328]|uniref:TadE/TadG family type IV pilus assembly protein n=1 Tax=Nonomuraea sp. NPDC050328 TaxID=3364361 RepID=UPI00379F8C69